MKKLNNKRFVLIAIVFLLVLTPSLATSTEETSSISRVVGESPNEILRQLQRDELNLQHVTYFADDVFNRKKEVILEQQFNSPEVGLFTKNTDLLASINNFKENELFILETEETPTINEVREWQQQFENKNPLLILDAPYAGAYLPKEDTVTSRLVRDTTIIAPTSFNSPQFTLSLLCQLQDDKTLGQIFKEARNFHYNGGSESSNNNLIGLTLQSYALYGNPRQVIKMDFNNRELIKNLCKNHLENLAPNIEFLENIGNYQKFRKHLVFEIPEVTITNQDSFQLIETEKTFQNLEFQELVLPMAVRTTHFPKNTIITDFKLDSVNDPEEITANIPSFENNLTTRICYQNSSDYEINFENSYTSTTQDFIAKISPVEIINCQNGEFKIHKKFNYHVDYIPLSPVLINKISTPLTTPINTLTNIEIELLQLTEDPEQGTLAILDDDKIIWEKEILTNETLHQASFTSPNKENLNKYTVEFLQDNETLNFKELIFETVIVEVKTNIPITAPENLELDINFNSVLDKDFILKGKYYLMNNRDVIEEKIFSREMSKGENIETLSFSNLKKEDKRYVLTLELSYLGNKKTKSYLLNTNNPPIFYINPEKEYVEGSIDIPFTLIDYDLDTVTIEIEKFTQEENSFTWETESSDVGTHVVEYLVSDGIETVKDSFEITILEKDNSCSSESGCENDEYCEFESCEALEGICKTKPDICAAVYNPVCGCDGSTYSSPCGVGAIDYSGECIVDNDEDGYTISEDCNDSNPEIFPNAPEICDNIDNNCNDKIDENLTQTNICGQEGEKTSTCVEGTWSEWSFCSIILEEECNNIDDNDNGEIDEGLSKQIGTSDIGVCEYGIEMCQRGTWLEILQSIGPSEEICEDGLDNNCDGKVDEECNPDNDLDGVFDANDLCNDTLENQIIDDNGCSCNQKTCDDEDVLTKNMCNLETAECENFPHGDINNDGCIDYNDFFIFSDNFHSDYNKISDFDNDGQIDYVDYFIFADNFGKGC